MKTFQIKFNDLLLFGLAFPILAASAILHEGILFWNFYGVYWSIFVLLLVWLVGLLFTKQKPLVFFEEPAITVSFILFYFFCVFQLIFFLQGTRTGWTTLDPYATYRTLPIIFAHILLFFFFLNSFRDIGRIRLFFDCLFMLASGLAMLGLLQDIIPNVWRKQMFFVKKIDFDFFSTFYSEDRFAFFLNLIFPYAFLRVVWELIMNHDWKKPFVSAGRVLQSALFLKIIALFILGLTIGWTGSRSGTFAAGISVALVFALLVYLTAKTSKEKLLTFLGFSCLGLITLFVLLGLSGVPTPLRQAYWWYLQIFDILGGNTADASFTSRVLAARDAFQGIQQFPIFGTGIGSFQTVFSQFRSPATGQQIWSNLHNEYLELLLETGLVGFTLLLIIPLCVFLHKTFSARRSFARLSPEEIILFGGCLIAVIAASIHSLSDFSLKFSTSMMVFLALIAALFRKLELLSPSPSSPRGFALINRLTTIIFLLLLAGNIYFFEQPYRAFRHSQDPLTAARLDPLNPKYYLRAFSTLMDRAQFDSATMESLEKTAASLAPTAATMSKLGQIYYERGNWNEKFYEKAEFFFQRALALAPSSDDALLDFVKVESRLAENKLDLQESADSYIQNIRKAIVARINRENSLNPSLKRELEDLFKTSKNPYLRQKLLTLLQPTLQT